MKHLKGINDNFLPINESREKISLGGYEYWLDRDKQVLHDTESSKYGTHYDSDNKSYVFSSKLTKDERKELLNYLKIE